MESNIRVSTQCLNHVASGMTYKSYYADKSIPKQHNKGLGKPKRFAGGVRASTIEFYKRLKKQGGVPEDMDFQTWYKIINRTNQKLMDTVLTSELGIRLPATMGILRIEGWATEPVRVFKNGKKSFTHNLHTFGYKFHMKWIKGLEVKMKLKDIYHFAATREVKRTMCQQIQNEFPYIKHRSKK